MEKAADRAVKFKAFRLGRMVTVSMVLVWTGMGQEPLWGVILINVLLFAGIFSRMIPAQALVSAIPEVTRRGAFNAISASLQQLAGGVSAAVAGAVIVEAADGTILHFNWLGYIVMCTTLASLALMYFMHKQVPEPASR